MRAFYHRTKIPISFWCRRGLNPKSLIQPSKILPIELIGTHYHFYYYYYYYYYYFDTTTFIILREETRSQMVTKN